MIGTLETVAKAMSEHVHAVEERAKQAKKAEHGGARKAQATTTTLGAVALLNRSSRLTRATLALALHA